MAHGGAWPCSGLAGPAWVVTSSPEHQRMTGKTRRGLRMEEWCGGALAAVSAISGEGATVRERRQRPHLRSNDRAEMTTSKRGSRRSFGEGVVRVFAVVSARELAEAHGGNGERWFRCFGCGGEGRKRRNELRHRGGSRWRAVVSNAELRPDMAWPVRAAPTRGHPRGVELLKLSAL